MLYRTLELVLPTGESFDIRLSDFSAYSEIESTEEFISVITKYSKVLNGIRGRKSELVKGKSKRFETLDQQIHCIVNARKYVDADYTGPSLLVTQKFKLNLQEGYITVYKFPSTSSEEPIERGTMYLSSIFQNWKEMFFPEYYPVIKSEVFESAKEISSDDDFFKLSDEKIARIVEDEECEEHDEDDEEYDDSEEVSYAISEEHRKKMKELITDQECESAYELWHDLFVEKELVDKIVIIKYSGAGDSGCTDDISVYDKARCEAAKDHEEVKASEVEMDPDLTHDDRLETLIWGLISTREAGFYNDDGGYGEMTLSSTSFQWDHYNYVSSIRHDVASSCGLDEDTKRELSL